MYEFPSLTLKIHLWRLTKEVDAKGYLVLRDHTLTTLKFTMLPRSFKCRASTTRMR
jgi:hypothetical protein